MPSPTTPEIVFLFSEQRGDYLMRDTGSVVAAAGIGFGSR
jgi:hypothetical protein